MLSILRARVCLLALATVVVGCQWSDPALPDGRPTPPSTCGNGTCEAATEDCVLCPRDCPCCAAVASNGSGGTVTDEANAIGASDGKSVGLKDQASLVLVVGREMYNDLAGTGPDFELIGQVTSTSSTRPGALCAAATGGTGAFAVYVSKTGSDYRFVGFWTKDNSKFDIGCAQLKSARYVRIVGQPGAQATLDALKASDSSCINPPVTP